MSELKVFRCIVISLFVIISSIIGIGESLGIAYPLIYEFIKFLPIALLTILTWMLFNDKIIRGFTIPVCSYYIYDSFLSTLYYVNPVLCEKLNTKYSYLFSIFLGILLLIIYWFYKNKRNGRMDKK